MQQPGEPLGKTFLIRGQSSAPSPFNITYLHMITNSFTITIIIITTLLSFVVC